MDKQLPDFYNYTIKELVNSAMNRVNDKRLDWQNTLLLTRANEDETFVLMKNGSRLLISKKMSEVLNDFSRENECFDRCIRPCYQFVKETIHGRVSGHYRLLPSSGHQNQDVVYYMAHHMREFHYLRESGEMVLTMVTDQGEINVKVLAYEKTFKRILENADAVSHLQLMEVHHKMHRYGIKHHCNDIANQYHENKERSRKVMEIVLERYYSVTKIVYKNLYGELPGEEYRKEFIRVLNEVYKKY